MKSIAGICLALALAGCATPYQDMGLTGGVTAAPMTDDVWRISARGNLYTDETRIQDYILLKAAETTVAAGRSHFAIVGLHDASRSRSHRNTGLFTFQDGNTTGLHDALTGRGRVEVKPGEDMMIRLLPPNASAEDKADALDARQLVANIGPRVKQPAP